MIPALRQLDYLAGLQGTGHEAPCKVVKHRGDNLPADHKYHLIGVGVPMGRDDHALTHMNIKKAGFDGREFCPEQLGYVIAAVSAVIQGLGGVGAQTQTGVL
ncbi:hypothetical protein D3C75_1157500 [compost metagenome]